MEMCEEKHDPIVTDQDKCPLCEIVCTLESAEKDVDEVREGVDEVVRVILQKFHESKISGNSVSELWMEEKTKEIEELNSKLGDISWS